MSGAVHTYQGYQPCFRNTTDVTESPKIGLWNKRHVRDTRGVSGAKYIYKYIYLRDYWCLRDTKHVSGALDACQRHLSFVWDTIDMSGTPETYLGHQGYAKDNRDVSGTQETCLTYQLGMCQPGKQFLNCKGLSWAKLSFDWKKVESQFARPKDVNFGNQEIRQPEPWNLGK